MYVQDENKDNDGGDGNIKENESVVNIQHPNHLLSCKLYVNATQKIKYKSIDF